MGVTSLQDLGGPLVHHGAVALPSAEEKGFSRVVCVGGGSSGFAFRPWFARSCMIGISGVGGTITDNNNNRREARPAGGENTPISKITNDRNREWLMPFMY
jgi:hypothetical protein